MSKAARFKTVFFLLVLFFFSIAVRAQPAFQVADLNTTRPEGMDAGPFYLPPFAALGGTVIFGASDGIHGFEPWRTDGTEAGTRRIADVCPGSCASSPKSFTTVGGKVFFLADDGLRGESLWKSDGTAAGTVLVKDLTPINEYVSFSGLAEINGLLLFTRSIFGRGVPELWRSDGTEAGTFALASLNVRSFPSSQIRIGGKLFLAVQDAEHGRELWTTDGTAAGTTLLKDIAPGPSHGLPDYMPMAVAGGRVFFPAMGSNGFELWASDGTEAGTALVKAIPPGSGVLSLSGLVARGGEVFFLVSRISKMDELWVSDGTAGGTRAIKSVSSGRRMATAGGKFFFFAGFPSCDLWTSDGTEAGTVLVKSAAACEAPLADNGTELLFFGFDPVHGGEPWKSDGTPAGTSLIADLYPGPTSSLAYQSASLFLAGRWYFQAKSGEDTGIQLWSTDGTAAGTRMLRINHQASGIAVGSSGKLWGPRAFFDLDGTLLFQGGDGATGAELWRSDGTAAGTWLVKDLWPGESPSHPGELTRAGGIVYFRSQAGAGQMSLWRTDGTLAGTQWVQGAVPSPGGLGLTGAPRDLTPFGGELLFLGVWGYNDHLLKTDGTWQGTGAVGTAPGTSFPDYVDSLVSLGDKVLFQADGKVLWTSDGHSAGTVPLAIVLHPYRYLLDVSAARDGVLLFPGNTSEDGEELWRSDGTEAGTYLLAEIVPGPGSKPLGPFASKGSTVFFAAGGNELWKNDAGGTGLVRVLPGDPDPGIRSLTAVGNKMYFSYDDGAHGRELWVSDGTLAGTRLVEDVLPGPGSSHPQALRAQGNVLLFSASDGVHGHEPWRSNGTALGTRMLHDVAPGALSSSPTEFTASGQNVYFAANDGTTGFELWALPRPALLSTFADVPASHGSWSYVEALAASGLTGGCGQDNYCPDLLLKRAESAVFLVKASHGAGFVPPAAMGTVFHDAPVSYWASPWIEQLAADGVTAGCGNGNFCPETPLSRAEAAVFLLRSRYGSGFVPPPATGTVFNDVPASFWAARWIERLAAEGVATGCGGGNYCPDRAVNRAEMAVFLTRMFALPLP